MSITYLKIENEVKKKVINGHKIRNMREAEGLSTGDFAKRVCTSQTMISHVELGIKPPSLELAERIAKYFNCTVNDLLIPCPLKKK